MMDAAHMTGNELLKITPLLLGRGLFSDGLPVPGPEFVEGERVGGTNPSSSTRTIARAVQVITQWLQAKGRE